jgi:hypothetical protein
MHWMIDGAHGDLYRTAMGYPELQNHDEWAIERARRPAKTEHRAAASSLFTRLASLAGQCRSIFSRQPVLERKPS